MYYGTNVLLLQEVVPVAYNADHNALLIPGTQSSHYDKDFNLTFKSDFDILPSDLTQ